MSKRVRPTHASGYDSFDMFCGAGGFSEGVSRRGVNVKAAANHERICVESHNSNFPLADHYLTDVSVADMRKFPRTRLLFASPECFPAGTPILCKRGLVPIEDVRVGDEALTHHNRWRPVTATMSTVADTVVVKGRGHTGLETTPGHPVWVRACSYPWRNDVRRNERELSEPVWMTAGALNNTYFWATPNACGDSALPVPAVDGRGAVFTTAFWWMVGRWLGDGSLRVRHGRERSPANPKRAHRPWPAACEQCGKPAARHKRYPHLATFHCGTACKSRAEATSNESRGSSVQICCAHEEAEDLSRRLAFAHPRGVRADGSELRWSRRTMRTTDLFDCPHNGLVEWLAENFGQHAHGKGLPTWALTLPVEWRTALLDGYLSADGHIDERAIHVSTVSRRLAIGVRLLAESLGHRTGMHVGTRTSGEIEGRQVAMRPLYSVYWQHAPQKKTAEATDTHTWGRVTGITQGRTSIRVFNLSVAADESYVADGIVVHNCTDWSLAKGARRRNMGQLDLWGDDGLDPTAERTRVTMWDPLRYCDIHDPDGGIIENVTEVPVYWRLWDTWLKGWADLGYETQVLYLNSAFAHPPVRPDGTYSLAAPQSRDRVYVVFKKKGLGKPLNIQIKPWAWCPACGLNVQAIQSWKPHNKYGRKGRYGATKQYVYRCPACAVVVTPYYWCAANAIDWTKRGERIGDRKKALAPKTVERIRYGLQKYGGHNPFLAGAYHCIPPWVRTTDRPFGTITSQDHHQLVQPEPFVMKVTHAGGTDNRAVRVSDRLPTQTSHAEIGLLTPPLMVSNYNGISRHPVRDVSREMPTMATGSGVLNHALVIPPYMLRHETLDATAAPAFTIQPNGRNNDPRAANDVFPTQTTGLNHALIVPSGGTWADDARPPDDPLPTQTATEAYGILMMARNHNTVKGAEEMFDTVVAGGNHHYLVRPFMLDYKGEPRRVVDALPT